MMTRQKMNKGNSKKKAAIVFLAPAVVFLSIFSVIPMLYSFGISFFQYNTSMAADTIQFNGLENYISVLSNRQFLDSTVWTFIFTICAVTLNVVIGMALALLLNTNYWSRVSKVFKTIFTMPMMIAPIVTATIWKLIFSPIYGVLNGILVTFGLERVNWMAETIPARIALIIVEVWATTPLCMLILIAALKTVPEELLEAATIDGANAVQKFKQITIPLIRNFIALVITMRFMDAIRMFDLVYNLTNGGPGTSTETLASTIYKTAFRYYNVGEGSAGAFIFFLLIIGFSVLSMRMFGEKREMKSSGLLKSKSSKAEASRNHEDKKFTENGRRTR